jgi:DNA-binding transcriptional LysR family regulator
MYIRHLRQLLAVRKHGSLAKAAEALGVSQPYLSKSIARLEDELCVALFIRTATGSVLTPIGEMVADRARRVLKETDDLIRETAVLARGDGGLVRIGFGAALRNSFLPRLLVTIAERHPRLKLHVEVGAGERLRKLVPQRELDIAFCALRADVTTDEFVYQQVLDGEIICAANPSHPLVGRKDVEHSAVLDYPCCGVRSEYFGNQVLLDGDEAATGATVYTTNDLDAAVPMVAASSTVIPHLRTGVLKQIDVGEIASVPFGAITTRAASASPILQKIVSYATTLGAEMDSEWRALKG